MSDDFDIISTCYGRGGLLELALVLEKLVLSPVRADDSFCRANIRNLRMEEELRLAQSDLFDITPSRGSDESISGFQRV